MTIKTFRKTAFDTECTETQRARRKALNQKSLFALRSSLCSPCLCVLRVESAF